MDNLAKKHIEKIRYFKNIISDEMITNLFINSIVAFKKMELSYEYRPDYFNYKGDLFLNIPDSKAMWLIENVRKIYRISVKLIPDKYLRYRTLIINRLSTNWWIHEILIEDFWLANKPHEIDNYLNITLSHLFLNIEEKDLINYTHETNSLSNAWKAIPYPLKAFSSKDIEYEKKIYKENFKPFYETEEIGLKKGQFVQGVQTDKLNTLINISNKIKDFNTSITYTNFNSFTFYNHWKKFYSQNKNNKVYKDLLYSIFYYEIQRNLLWNTVFFLPASTFLNIYESKIKDSLFDKINEKYKNYTYKEASYVTQKVISSLKDETDCFKEFVVQTNLNLPKPISNYGKYVPVADEAIFGSAKIKDIRLGEIQYSYQDSFVSLLIKEDIKTWVPEWSENIKVKRILNIVDHSETSDEGENEILNDIEKAIKKEDLFFKFCKLSDDGKNLKPLFKDNYKELSSKRTELVTKLIKLLYPLKLFNKRFIGILNNPYKLGLTKVEIDETFKINEPLFSPINNEWYRIEHSKTVEEEINPRPLNKLRKDVLNRIASFLVKEIENNRNKEENDVFTKEIAPLLEYLYFEIISVLFEADEMTFIFLSRFAKSLQLWEPNTLFSLISFAKLNESTFTFEKYNINVGRHLSSGLKGWFEIAENKKINNKGFIQNATLLSEKLCTLEINDNIKSSILSASIIINLSVKGSIKKSKIFLKELFLIDKTEKPYLREADILRSEGNFDDAISSIREALRLFPKEIKIYKKLQYLYNETKQYNELIEIEQAILNKFTEYKHETLINLSNSYLKNKQFEEAEKYALKAIQNNNDSFEAYDTLATIFHETNDYPREIETEITILNKFDKEKGSITRRLGEAYILNNQISKATETGNELIKKYPDDINGYVVLYSAYSINKEYEKEINIHLEVIKKFKDYKYPGLCKLSEAYFYNNQFTEAIKSAKEAIELNSEDIKGYVTLCSIYRHLKQYSNEINTLSKILGKFKEYDSSFLNKLAEAYLLNQQTDEAEKTALKAIELKPGEISGYSTLISIYRETKQYEKEIKSELEILSKFKDYDYSILNILAEAYLLNQQTDEAERTALKAIDLKPGEISGYSTLISIYRETKQYEKEIKSELEILTKFKEYDYSILNKLAEAYLLDQQVEEAEKAALKAIDLKPDEISGYFTLISIYRETKQYEKEIKSELEILSKFKDYDYSILIKLAEAYLLNQQTDKAEKAALKAINLKPDDIGGYASLHPIYRELKQYSKEINIHLHVIDKFEDFRFEGLKTLSEAHLLNQQTDEAEKTALKAIELKPGDISGYSTLISIYRETKQYEKEIKSELEILSKFKDYDYSILNKLAEAYLLNQQTEEAVRTALKAIELKPTEVDGYIVISSIYREIKNYDKEIEVHKKIASSFPKYKYSGLMHLAQTYILNQQYKKAEVVALRALNENRKGIFARTILVEVYDKFNKPYSSIKLLKEIIKLDEKDFENHYYELAKRYLIVMDYYKAKYAINQAIKIERKKEFIELKEELLLLIKSKNA